MKRIMLTVMLAAAGAWGTLAQVAPVPAAKGTIEVPVKQYKALLPPDVYRAASNSIQADVNFRDAFTGRMGVPGVAAQVVVHNVQLVTALAFRTQGGLICLVPYSNEDALRMLLGLPADWELTEQDLAGPVVLNMRQTITIEGTVVGTRAGEKYVAVDSVLTGGLPSVPVHTGLQIFWPGAQTPRVVSAPGNYTFSFPCATGEAKTLEVKVSVAAVTASALRDVLAGLAAEREALPGGTKTYGEYATGVAYRYAMRSEPVNVDFTDRVARVIGFGLPPELVAAPSLRSGVLVAAPVGHAFITDSGITCLAPLDQPSLVARAASALPGEEVRIRGTTTGLQGGYACVLADYIGFPAQETAGRTTWMVTMEWPGAPAKTLWDYGMYSMVDLPCQPAAGQAPVTMQVLLSEFKTLEVELPPAPGAAQPAPGAGQ